MRIKELTIKDDNMNEGITAMSFVEDPAIETNFMYFSKEDFLKKGVSVQEPKKITPTISKIMDIRDSDGNFKYWRVATANNEPWKLDNSHAFCKNHADPTKNIFTIKQINDWSNNLNPNSSNGDETKGWIAESDFCKQFKGKNNTNFNLDNQLYNCRHFLTPVYDINEVPQNIRFNSVKQNFSMNFSVSDNDKRIVKGVAMIPELFILRRDEYTGEEYYVWFSKETIKKLKERYGYNRTITIQHEMDYTGNAILLNSWLYPDVNDNCGVENLKFGAWCVEYKILSDRFWEVIKKKGVKGFSVELSLSV